MTIDNNNEHLINHINEENTEKMDSLATDGEFFVSENELKTANIISSEIVAKLGNSEEEINENSVFLKATLFKNMLQKLSNKNHKIFIYFDHDDINYAFAEIFIKILSSDQNNKITVLNAENNLTKDFALNEIFKQSYDYSILFLKENDFYKIVFKKRTWDNLTKKEEQFLNKLELFNTLAFNKVQNREEGIVFLDKRIIKSNKTVFSDNKYLISIDKKDDLSVFLPYKNISIKHFNGFLNGKEIPLKREIKQTLLKEKKEKKDILFFNNIQKQTKNIFVKNLNNKYIELTQDDINLLTVEYISDKNNGLNNVEFHILDDKLSIFQRLLRDKGITNIIQSPKEISLTDFVFKNKNKIKNLVFVYDGIKIYKIDFSNKNDLVGFENVADILFNIEVFDYFKNNKKDICNSLTKIKKEIDVNVSRFNKTIAMSFNSFLKFVKKIKREKMISKYKILEFDLKKQENLYSKRTISIKLTLENGFIINFYFDKVQNLLQFSTFSTFIHKQEINSIIKKEDEIKKEIIDFSISLKETNINSKIKNIFKFASFLVIIFVIFVILFSTIYRTKESDAEGVLGIFVIFYNIFLNNYLNRFFSIAIGLSFLFYYLFSTFMLYRILKKQGTKVKFKHLYLAIFIGTIVQNITPFAFGGDLSSYWYLQKKGYNKSHLASAFALSSLFQQISILITSFIFIPLGFYLYRDTLLVDIDAKKIITFISLILGILLNIVLFFIILLISVVKPVQHFIIRVIIFFHKLHPLYYFSNLDRKKIVLENKFSEFKNNIKNVFKDIKLFLECIFLYKILNFILNGAIFIALMIQPKILEVYNAPGQFMYWFLNFLAGSALVNTANNLSPTPGGIGTSDWLLLVIFKNIFVDKNVVDLENNLKIFSFSLKIFYWLVPNILSGLMLLTLYLGEKRVDKYKNIESLISIDSNLSKNYKKTKTIYFKNALIIWIVFSISILSIIFFH
ncbi:lysylphosphatidylglycerol synthase transmembrane domain-containing protein [Mycoplasma sp. Z386]